MERYRILTDAFALDQPLYVGDTQDGEPVWVRKESAFCFDEQSAALVAMRLDQVTLEAEDATLDQVKPRLPIILFQPNHLLEDDA
jgi:hypothetical protein